ncbi:MAG: hypothetical protein ABSA76_06225 [Bacteroidales bacterium]
MKKLLLFAVFAMGVACYGQFSKNQIDTITISNILTEMVEYQPRILSLEIKQRVMYKLVQQLIKKIQILTLKTDSLEKRVKDLEDNCLALKQDSTLGWMSVDRDSLDHVKMRKVYVQSPSFVLYKNLNNKKK